ncbi:mutator type transposase [Tanacetum coccineum]
MTRSKVGEVEVNSDESVREKALRKVSRRIRAIQLNLKARIHGMVLTARVNESYLSETPTSLFISDRTKSIARTFQSRNIVFASKHINDNMTLTIGRVKSNFLLNNLCDSSKQALLDGRLEKSDVAEQPLILQKPHHHIGRPPKKRKKSAAELADEMMKSKKLTKTGKSVTCKSCKQVGHNSRGCKSKKGGGSQQAGVAGHRDAAHRFHNKAGVT